MASLSKEELNASLDHWDQFSSDEQWEIKRQINNLPKEDPQRIRQQDQDYIWSIYDDIGNLSNGLSEESKQTLDNIYKRTEDRESLDASIANSFYFSHNYKGMSRDYYMQNEGHILRSHFGKEITPKEAYAAYDGDLEQALGNFPDGYNEERLDEYRSSYKKAFNDASSKYAPYKDLVDDVVLGLEYYQRDEGKEEMGVLDRMSSGRQAVEDFRERISRLSDEEQNIVLYMLSINAEARAKARGEDEKGFVKQTFEALTRGIKDLGGRAIRRSTYDYLSNAIQNEVDATTHWDKNDSRLMALTPDLAISKHGQKISIKDRFFLNEEMKKNISKTAIDAKLWDVAQGTLDPVEGNNFFTEKIWYPAMESVAPYAINSLNSFTGLAINQASFFDQSMRKSEQMYPNMSRNDMITKASIEAPIMAGIEKLQFDWIFKFN